MSVTILDYLDEDCWSLVLCYVPLQDVIRTECVSSRWQRMVMTYLSHTRIGIKIECITLDDGSLLTGTVKNVRWVFLRDSYMPSFVSWTHKLGASVVAGYCSESSFSIIGENCPNLEGVTFLHLREEMLLNNKHENFKRLQMLRFLGCFSMTDISLSQYITSPMLAELLIVFNDQVTGQCFINIQSNNLKTLDFQYCKALACRLLPAASNHFGRLTRLVLEGINCVNILGDFGEKEEPFDDILLVLEKTPMLEHLKIWEFGKYIDNFFESVCKLRCLRELDIDINWTDEDIAAVTRCCPELRILKFQNCQAVTGRGLRAACANAGARLTVLAVPHSQHLTDDDVEACVRACPNLLELDVTYNMRLTRGVLLRAAAARRAMRALRPLRLLVSDYEFRQNEPDNHEPIGIFEELDLPYIRRL